jgi:hypothetical protein
MASDEKQTPEQATLGHGAPGDPERTEHARPGEHGARYLDVPVATEKTDVDVKPVARVGAILAGTAVVSVAITLGVFKLLAARERRDDPPPPPLARAENRQFPEPRLQTQPVDDFHTLKARDQELLSGAGWADRAAGIARIPIDHAITLYADLAAAGRPLPLAPVNAAAATTSPAPGGTGAPAAAPSATPGASTPAGGHR